MPNGWKNIDFDKMSWEELSANKKKERLLKECNYMCQCGFNKVRPSNGRHILELDHIDGNHQNMSRENLRILCPNCHALTHNFRNNGRKKSTRIGRTKAGKQQSQERIALQNEADKIIIEKFKNDVLELFNSKIIDFSKRGWRQRVHEKLGLTRRLVSIRIQVFMPEFYITNCFRPIKHK